MVNWFKSTQQQVNEEYEKLVNFQTDTSTQLTEIQNTLLSVAANPTQPDAQSKYDIAKERYDLIKQTEPAWTRSQRSTIASLEKTLTPKDAQEISNKWRTQESVSRQVVGTQLRLTDISIQEAATAIETKTPSSNVTVTNNNGQETLTLTESQNTNKSDEDTGNGTVEQTPVSSQSTGPATSPRINPLSKFASYTYQITLYMITPDAYDAFVDSGRKGINALRNSNPNVVEGGAKIIVQSGGVNPQDKFNPYFNLDYYIDNLTFTSYISADAPVTATAFEFNVVEPYGFSFLSNLRRAALDIESYSGALTEDTKVVEKIRGNNSTLSLRQFFVLGIRFYGYDQNGNLLTGKNVSFGTESDELFEQFYDINIKQVRFKIDGKATVYNIKAEAQTIVEAFGTKRGTIKQGSSFKAATLGQALENLANRLNQIELDNNKNTKLHNTYSIEYIGDPSEIERIKKASMVIPSDIDKAAWAGSSATTTDESNEALSVSVVPDSTQKEIAFRNETSVAEAINSLFKQSTYMTDALTTVNSAQQTGAPVNTPSKQELKWFNLSAEVKNATWNPDRNDWVYNITYVIQPYATPAAYSPFISQTQSYYGPHKKYEYIFTGQNSEIISFDVAFDNTYMNVVVNDDAGLNKYAKSREDGSPSAAPIVTGKRVGSQPRMGITNLGLEAQNQVLTSIYDPDAYAKAKLVILGDPDFLISANPSSLSQVYNRFYSGNGFTVNPNGGQVFIEVNFNEGIDYDTSKTGLMSINESILFWQYPEIVANVTKGIIFQIKTLTSKFENGKFIQTLDLAVPDMFKLTTETTDITATRSDTDKEAAQDSSQKENTRTLSTQTTDAAPVTVGSVPKENNVSKASTQLVQDGAAATAHPPRIGISLDPAYNLSQGDD